MFRPHVITAIASRNIKTFFTSVIGYLFIVVFVVVSGFIAFGPKFFGDNLATLDQLTNAYPLLLLFLVPAISMGVWSDEKKQGTDAILFTLPASDFEILIGKYISVVVVYVAALLFSLTQLIALATIGTPDWGVIFATYFGYFLAGAALLSIGMFASSLTSNTTVAFVLGAMFCAWPVFIGDIAPSSRFLQSMSLAWQLREFGEGSIGLSNVLYFVFLKNVGLFLNYVVITKRHWSTAEESSLYGLFAGQIVSILILMGSLYFLSAKVGNYVDTELDVTMQQVNSLSKKTIDTISESGRNRNVEIQAFVSDDVPTEFVSVKKRLLRLLRQYTQRSGNSIDLRIVDVKANSDSVLEARAAGVEPIDHKSEVAGREIRQDVYMGLVFSSSIGKSIIPQIDTSTPLEYELTRAIGTTGVLRKKLRLGVLETDGKYQGLDGSFELNHLFVGELEKRYDVARVTAEDLTKMIEQQTAANEGPSTDSNKKDGEENDSKDAEKKDESSDGETADDADKKDTTPNIIIPDVMLVFRTSLLPPETQTELLKYIDLGNPVVITVDPLPVFPWSVLPGAEGRVLDTPTDRMLVAQGGFTRESKENNDCSLLFDALQLNWNGVSKQATIKGTPPRPNQFGGPPSGGTPDRQAEAFYPTIVAQSYRPFDELRFEDTAFKFRSNGQEGSIDLTLGEERNGVPIKLGTPNAMMINAKVRSSFNPFNDESVISSGINNVLMFYAGALSKKDFSDIKNSAEAREKFQKQIAEMQKQKYEPANPPKELAFTPIISAEDNALGLPWDEVISKSVNENSFQPVDEYQIEENPNFYRFELAIDDTEEQIAAAKKEKDEKKVESLTEQKKSLEKEQAKYKMAETHFAVRVTGQRQEGGNEIDAVVIADSDFATNFFFAVASVLNEKPDNVEFLMNVVDSLGGKADFVELRARNPKQRTLTYMDKKRDEYRSSRLGAENSMRKEFQKQTTAITDELKKKEAENRDKGIAGLFKQLTDEDEAINSLSREKEKLQKKLDEDIEELKSKEARNITETEGNVRFLAIFLPPLPALFLGIFVFVYGFIKERSHVNEKRRH